MKVKIERRFYVLSYLTELIELMRGGVVIRANCFITSRQFPNNRIRRVVEGYGKG